MQRANGATLVEMLISMTVGILVLLGVLGAYSQGNQLKERIQGSARIQDNVRLGMGRVERDLLMAGYGVPTGKMIGGTTLWMPAIFHASPTAIGFRSEIDNGVAEVICTPKSSNAACPLNKLRLDSIDYFNSNSCQPPDGASGSLKLVIVLKTGAWEPLSCSGVDTSDTSILVSTVTDGQFGAGDSEAVTVEQVYLRYDPSTLRPYGSLLRQVRYDNSPNDTFPATGVKSQAIARHLLDFWLEYYDETGTQLVGNPLSLVQREAIRSIVIFMEGYDQIGPEGHPQLIQLRSEVLVRNV